MTRVQRIQIAQSETREAIAAILDAEGDRSDEQRTELATLTDRAKELESELRAALAAEGEPDERPAGDGEERELRGLMDAANIGAIFEAAYEQRSTSGPEAELQQHLNMGAHDVPLALVGIEQRDAQPTAQAPGTVQGNQQAIVPAVFPTAVATAMGVERVTVPVGTALYPVMRAPNDAPGEVAEGVTVDDTTGTFVASPLAPVRIQRSFTHSREDAATFRGMADALRMNLRESIAAGLDRQALLKPDAGLLDFGADPNATVAVETWASFTAAAFGQVDGRYANGLSGLRLLVGAKTYGFAGGVYRTDQSEESALDWLMERTGGVQVSAHVAAGDVEQAVIARGLNLRHAVQPVWDNISVIVDPYSESKDGLVRLTAVALANFAVVRSDGYSRIAFRNTA